MHNSIFLETPGSLNSPAKADIPSPTAIENFRQKECYQFVPHPEQRKNIKVKDVRCFCGEVFTEHAAFKAENVDYDAVIKRLVPQELQDEFEKSKWEHTRKPRKITHLNTTSLWKENFKSEKTNAYGKVFFTSIGDIKPAEFIRVSNEDNVESVWDFLKTTWRLMTPPPDLIVSIVGGAKNFRLEGLARDKFENGLLKIAETTQSLFITSGFNVGIMKAVGQIIKQGQSYSIKDKQAVHSIRCLAITPWGFVKNRHCLEKRDADVTYGKNNRHHDSLDSLALNPYHTHFVLVDSGYRNRFVQTVNIAEYRAGLEMEMNKESEIADRMVLVVVEGELDDLSVIKRFLASHIPVVICKGTGGACDLLADALSGCDERGQFSKNLNDNMKRWLLNLSGRTWSDEKEVEKLEKIVDECLMNKDKITVFDIQEDQGLDFYVLSALVHQHRDYPRDDVTHDENRKRNLKHREDKLDLAISLNRPDLAEAELFTENDYWPAEILHKKLEGCITAELDGFVRLLIQQENLDIEAFLTGDRLETLYRNSLRKGSLLYKLLSRADNSSLKAVTLRDIGQVIRGLLDTYDKEVYGTSSYNKLPKEKDPYLQLFTWAVLNERKTLAKLFWEFVDTPVATALLGSWLYFKMSNRLGAGDQEWAKSLQEEKRKMEQLAVQALSELHARYPEQACHCVEKDTPLWGNITCLQIASAADAKLFLGSTTCEKSLWAEWVGDVKMQLWETFVCLPLCIFVPFLVDHWGRFREPTKSETWTRKITEFICSPRVKFIHYVIWYAFFLVLFTYLILFEVKEKVCALEWICAAWAFSILLDECQRIIAVPALSKKSLFYEWRGFLYWVYLFGVLMLVLNVFIHAFTRHIQVVKNIYAVTCAFFYLRILRFYTASEHLGPRLRIIKSTLRPLFFFGMITLVFLFAYGVPSQALMYEKRLPYWGVLYDIVYVPYWQIYGELQLENIESDESCFSEQLDSNIPDPSSCRQFSALVPLLLAIYLFFANVLLLNLIIAIFTKIFETVESNSVMIWKYQMYFFIKEYKVKSVLPTPISVLEDTVRIANHILHSCCGTCLRPAKALGKEERKHLRWVDRQVTDGLIRKMKEIEDLTKNKHLHSFQKSINSLRSNLIGDLSMLYRTPNVDETGAMITSCTPHTSGMPQAIDKWRFLIQNRFSLAKSNHMVNGGDPSTEVWKSARLRDDSWDGKMDEVSNDNVDNETTVDDVSNSDIGVEVDSS